MAHRFLPLPQSGLRAKTVVCPCTGKNITKKEIQEIQNSTVQEIYISHQEYEEQFLMMSSEKAL
ncbi:UNVERIFIED_CONTAM: hypothetical protein NCL1_44770 [Trichonephila clavipes]